MILRRHNRLLLFMLIYGPFQWALTPCAFCRLSCANNFILGRRGWSEPKLQEGPDSRKVLVTLQLISSD